MKLKDIMQSPATIIEPHAELASARSLMRRNGIRHLPVVDDGHLVGLLSDRDVDAYAQRTGESIFSGGLHAVSAAMQTTVETASPDDSIRHAMGRMATGKMTCLPLVVDDAVVGIVTTTDLLAVQARAGMYGHASPSQHPSMASRPHRGAKPKAHGILTDRASNRHLIDRLWVLTATPTDALTPSRWRKLLSGEIRELLSILQHQFAAEERDGYMRNVLDARFDLAPQVDMLHAQHRALSAEFEQILDRLRAGQDVASSQRRIRSVLSNLRAHDAGEEGLIQQWLDRDTACQGIPC